MAASKPVRVGGIPILATDCHLGRLPASKGTALSLENRRRNHPDNSGRVLGS